MLHTRLTRVRIVFYLCDHKHVMVTLMERKKLSYLCPQVDVIALGAREFICQSSTDVNLGSENIVNDMGLIDLGWENLL